MTDVAPQVHSLTPNKSRVVSVDMTGQLDSGETLAGTPVVVENNTSALTITGPVVNTAELEINDRTVAIGKAVQFTVSGNLQGRYVVSAYAVSSASQDIGGSVRINVG